MIEQLFSQQEKQRKEERHTSRLRANVNTNEKEKERAHGRSRSQNGFSLKTEKINIDKGKKKNLQQHKKNFGRVTFYLWIMSFLLFLELLLLNL